MNPDARFRLESSAWHIAGIAFAAALVGAGCTHTEPAVSVSVKLSEPGGEPPPSAHDGNLHLSASGNVFQQATPEGPLAAPAFPKGWAQAITDPLFFVFTVSIDDQGRVTDVERSLRDFSPSKGVGGQCREALRQAVLSWKFKPAVIAQVEPEPDGSPLITAQHTVETTLEVEFTLTSSQGLAMQLGKR